MIARPFIVACVQTNSGGDVAANMATAARLIRAAREAGAELIAVPENVVLMASEPEVIRSHAAENRALSTFQELAAETGAWLLIGSLAMESSNGRVANRSILIDGQGAVVAHYDKIHMFDVDLPSGETYRESATYRPGGHACLAPTPWGPLGMTVCYDLRFPHLYRELAKAGAALIAVPSAFTKVTGRAHWHVLLRARAIETGCFLIAPAQCGTNYGDRQTYGHALVVDPWGQVLADAGEDVGFVTATLDLARVDEVRAMVPSLRHDRPFQTPFLDTNSDSHSGN